MKLSANFLFATVFESLGEAVALIDKAGIDKRSYVEFLTTGMFSAPAYKILMPTFSPTSSGYFNRQDQSSAASLDRIG